MDRNSSYSKPKMLYLQQQRQSSHKRRKVVGDRRCDALWCGHAHVVDQVQAARDLSLKLVAATEDMSIVLHEASDSREASECAAELVAVQNPELCKAQRQFAVGPTLGAKHEAVAGTVHGLQGKLLLLDLEHEHVLLVVLGVAADVPQLHVEDVWGGDFSVAAHTVSARNVELQQKNGACGRVHEAYCLRMNSISVLYSRVPMGEKNAEPGDSSLNLNKS